MITRLTKYFVLLGMLSLVACHSGEPLQKVLIIQDETLQMEVLSSFLQEHGPFDVTVVDQNALPEDFSIYEAVILYIHGGMDEPVELRAIQYTKDGGRLVLLHHSISSGKARNKYYFDFLGMRLDDPGHSSGPVEPGGGYGWRDEGTGGAGVTLTVVNLNPGHYITSHLVNWPDTIRYTPSDFPSAGGDYPAIHLPHSEVYLNHKFTDGREKTVLMGLKYYDDRVDHTFMQDRAGWIKPQGQGMVVYLMPGHSASDYQNPNIAQIVLNAINWKH